VFGKVDLIFRRYFWDVSMIDMTSGGFQADEGPGREKATDTKDSWDRSASSEAWEAAIDSALHDAAELLPAQGSLKAFVHHNTLHAFEQMPFFAALREGGRVYQAEGLLSEREYREECLRDGVGIAEIDSMLRDDLGTRADDDVAELVPRFSLRRTMLHHPLHFVSGNELEWLVNESADAERYRSDTSPVVRDQVVAAIKRRFVGSDALPGIESAAWGPEIRGFLAESNIAQRRSWGEREWERWTLRMLWIACRWGLKQARIDFSRLDCQAGLRDWLLAAGRDDIDLPVNEVLIRFTSAFLDQGFAQSNLPDWESGYFESFISLYQDSWFSPHTGLVDLQVELRRLRRDHVSPRQSIIESLQILQVPLSEVAGKIRQSLLSLRGWAALIHQIEARGDRVNRGVPEHTLLEFLAVRLILERASVAAVLKCTDPGKVGPAIAAVVSQARQIELTHQGDGLAYAMYEVAQLQGWRPDRLLLLTPDQWREILAEIDEFDSFERRRIYHLALERSYRERFMQGLVDNTASDVQVDKDEPVPCYQMICCIDDREESLRRHLEEVRPECETFGYAGFFAVPIYFQGIADAHFSPLCPVVIKPAHYVREYADESLVRKTEQRHSTRRFLGRQAHAVHNISRSLIGGIVVALLGLLSTFPLVVRVLFPRLAARLRRRAGRLVSLPTETRLTLLRTGKDPGSDPESLGFQFSEMADSVERVLRDTGLTTRFARLIVICGHGSASLNNPHESAYNCGACGGGRGGPNARTFCWMANHLEVRRLLRDRGLVIPDSTYFMAMFHNTCDDSFVHYDPKSVPFSSQADVAAFLDDLEQARQRNAHERCRRFASASPQWSSLQALRHVEARAEDLSQTRPEYNHATNAACVVGRRERTRGLFLDRRAFLASYDWRQEPANHEVLKRTLAAVVPVCAGINLEYYFSRVDVGQFGCGSKLPHNVTSLLGVMDGASSDLRTGLSAQMVEIHQPLRLLLVVEAPSAVVQEVIETSPQLRRLCFNEWVQLATLSPESQQIEYWQRGQWVSFPIDAGKTPTCQSSSDWYAGYQDHLEPALIRDTAPIGVFETSVSERGGR
jgi:uncharacterized protein YbcC (UPF0753/DUF2309 family)